MAEILSQSEQTNLDALLNIGQYTHYWIGLSDMAHEGKFEWQHSFTPLGEYTNWNAGEPNDQRGDEDCVHMLGRYYRKAKWSWNDYPCDHDVYESEEEIHGHLL